MMSTTDVVRIVQQGATANEEQGRLKADLQYLRRRGLFKASGELSYQGRKCSRCDEPFGRFYNTGATCARCRHRVCRQCRVEIKNHDGERGEIEWICNVCHRIAQLHVVSGKWICEDPVSNTSTRERISPSPLDILKHSIRRAWTINGPPIRWFAARKSPELRIYHSLPSRHRAYLQTFEDSNENRTLSKSEESRENDINAKDYSENNGNSSRDVNETIEKNSSTINERTKRDKLIIKTEEEVPSLSDAIRYKRGERSAKSILNDQEESISNQEQSTSRISLIKPPKILAKLISIETKINPTKHGERKSNIPIFRRSSKEFEDIRGPQESPKRSLIPQRYRGSTDDLRRSREDISVPSLIPKLLSSRSKEDRLKRQDSKDDIRHPFKLTRRDSKEEAKCSSLTISTITNKDESTNKSEIRIFRRDNSRENVGRDGTNSFTAAKGKQYDKLQERAEDRGVGGTVKLKVAHEENRSRYEDSDNVEDLSSGKNEEVIVATIQNEFLAFRSRQDRKVDAENARMTEAVVLAKDKSQNEQLEENMIVGEIIDEKHLLVRKSVDSSPEDDKQDNLEMRDTAEERLLDNSDGDITGIPGERKNLLDFGYGKKVDEPQVVRRKFSKEEFSNPDDTDDTPNKRCSSHLSPEASPLSTRSSRYSPRESESEPTPALPRKIGGDSCSASQRIRDAITRTRRESNSSTRYESSGSESIKLSQTGLHGYVELARKVKFFGGNGSSAISSAICSDEVVQRDSATSAGEDETNEDGHDRTGPILSQGRTMLRRRRQFDAQGLRRRGRSHARSCCVDELQSLQTLHLIGRGGHRQRSPNPSGQGQDQTPVVDYRRLVFISSDSSSGREEDDADSSCSSSSYLNGLPRNGHAQSLEDCDWDYFESGSLPLPSLAIGSGNVGLSDTRVGQDWSCCPGRGSTACQACGGSRSTNVLPVPVPIPVPVPYPVPIPAALWTGDFAAAASSMISRDSHVEPGTLRLRGEPSAPWFAWHPHFNQALHGPLDPRLTGTFDPTTCTFTPDRVMTPRLYNQIIETTTSSTNLETSQQYDSGLIDQDVRDDATIVIKPEESLKEGSTSIKDVSESHGIDSFTTNSIKSRTKLVEAKDNGVGPKRDNEDIEKANENEEIVNENSLLSLERNAQKMFQHPREDSGSSSGRSSADSSDLEDDSSPHRFSRVFVVNDDSLTSDNDIEDNEENDDSDSAEGGVILKRINVISEEEPVVLQHVRLLNEDTCMENENIKSENKGHPKNYVIKKTHHENNDISMNKQSANLSDKRKNRCDNSNKRLALLLQHRLIPEEMYLADDNDCSDDQIELKSIRMLDPDNIDVPMAILKTDNNSVLKVPNWSEQKVIDTSKKDQLKTLETSQDALVELKSLSSNMRESTIVPDSLEILGEHIHGRENNISNQDKFAFAISDHNRIVSLSTTDFNNDCEMPIDKSCLSATDRDFNSNGDIAFDVSIDNSTSNESNTTGSEISSDELHEYEVTPSNSLFFDYDNEVTSTNDKLLYKTNKYKTENMNSLGNIKENGNSLHNNNKNGKKHPNMARNFKWNTQSEKLIGKRSMNNTNAIDVAGINTKSMISAKNNDRSVLYHHANTTIIESKDGAGDSDSVKVERSEVDNVDDIIPNKIQEIFKSAEHAGKMDTAHDGSPVRGETTDTRQVGGNDGDGSGDSAQEGGTTRFRSVERRPSIRKENGFPADASAKNPARDAQYFPSVACNNNNSNNNNSNKYRSLVMITQEASYQPVSVVTSDTTTLLQPDEIHSTGQGLAGYFHLALEAASEQPQRKNGQGPRRPLMVKRLSAATHQSEPEVDSGLSVGSASENDDISASKISCRQENVEDVLKEPQMSYYREYSRPRASSQPNDDNSGNGGIIILEEGLADDDSWVEEVSHDEDEPGATTATEESSEDESNNFGDREEELRGYRRQAIDFTLHTIVEESCEESETEPSLATGSPLKKQRPPSASELEKYFFFGLGGDGNNSNIGSREVDSLSETSSIYSEGLESLGQDETNSNGQAQERLNSGENFLNSSRLEKYYLSEFLGFDQDRRDSDGSVGSDSEGRPSPEAQRRKKLVRARGTGRSHSSSLDNLLALTQSSQNLSSQNSLQDLSLNQEAQESQSEGSSTETDGTEDGQTAAFGTEGQYDTIKRKKKKLRNLGTQSPRVSDDRNKTPEPNREMMMMSEIVMENEKETINSEDSERAKTPQPELALSSSLSPNTHTNTLTCSSSQMDTSRNVQLNSIDPISYHQRSKQQSRDSGFVGSCDDLLLHQKLPDESHTNSEADHETGKNRLLKTCNHTQGTSQNTVDGATGADKNNLAKQPVNHTSLPHLTNASLSRKDSFNNWSSDEETNLMMSKMRQFFKTMIANSNSPGQNIANSPRLPASKTRLCTQNRTKPPQLVYFENELTRLMKTVPGIRDEQVREIVEYLSSEDTWSDSYDSSDYTSSDLEGAASGRRSALQEQISQSCQQIISKFDTTSGDVTSIDKEKEVKGCKTNMKSPGLGRDTAFVYQKLVQSFTKITSDSISSDTNSTPHSSPPLIANVMHHIGSRLVALMHEVSESNSAAQHHSTTWRRYSQHHRTPSSASTTASDDDSTSDSTNAPSSAHLQLPRSKSHDPLLLINNHPTISINQEGEEREASDYERFSWRGSFESALMATDSRTKLSLLACSGDVSVNAGANANALAMAAKRRSAGDLLFNPKSFSREQLDRVRSCGSIGGGSGSGVGCGGSIEERIWSNRRRSSVPDANTRGESGTSAGDDDTEDELEYGGESRATTLPRGMQSAVTAATNSLPRLPASTISIGLTTTTTSSSSSSSSSPMHKAHSIYHFLPQHSGVKSARYRPPGFARNSNITAGSIGGPKRALSAPGLQISGLQTSVGKRENSRSRRQQTISLTSDDGSNLSEACSTPIIGAGSRASSSHTVIDIDDIETGLHSSHLATRASLSSLGARSDSMASVYSGAGEGRCCRSVVVTGEVEFALQYDYKHLTFEVHVTKCKNLAPVDVKRKRSDPYVKVYLLPDKSKSGKRKTKVKKHTLNPEFNETLKFHMSLSGLETRTLWLTVWHSDMFGRNDFLGEVRMPLENKIFDDPTPHWYPLQERTEPFDDPVTYKGEVIVGLKFVPPDPVQQERERENGVEPRGVSKSRKNWSRGSLHVLVKEARNLQTRAKNSGTCDPFCKSYLLPDKGRSGKQKTNVVRRSGGSPVWGHTFIYKDVSLQELAERGLELTVWDHDRIASNEFLGGVRFNLGTGKHYGKLVDWMDATGRELSLWQSMLERPNFWVEGAVTLRPNLHNHGKNNTT